MYQKHRNDISKLLSHGVKESELGYLSSLKTHQTEHENGPNVDINTSLNGWQNEVNNMNNQNHQSSMMNGPLQENIPEPAPYRPFLIGNGLDFNQHEGYGRLIIEPSFVDLDEFFNNLDGIDPK